MPAEPLPTGINHALLGLLVEHPMHPYEMHQQLLRAEALGLVWHLKQAHLYALLTRLQEAGYITSVTEAQGSRPPRKVFHLTAEGKAAYAAWVAAPVEHGRDFRLEFLAKLFFAAREGTATVTALIERQKAICRQWIADIETDIQALGHERRYDRLVLEFRRGQLEAILPWLDQCQEELAASTAER
jgi:DNA-binding PadR family transcriptional regulator